MINFNPMPKPQPPEPFIPRREGAIPGLDAEFVSDTIRSTAQIFEQDFPGTQVMYRPSLLLGMHVACVFCEGAPDGPEFINKSALVAGMEAMEEYQKRAVREMELREARDAGQREPNLSEMSLADIARLCHEDFARFQSASDADRVGIFNRWEAVLLRKMGGGPTPPTPEQLNDPSFYRRHFEELPGWLAQMAEKAENEESKP